MALARRFLRGSVLNLTDQGLRFAAVFIMTPVMVGLLGQERYGLWVLLMSIVGHYALLDFGMSFSISRFFSRAIGAGDDDRLSSLISTSFLLMGRIAAVALVITAVGFLVVPAFGLDDGTTSLVRTIVLVYGIYLALGFPVRVFRSLLKSHLRYDLLVLASIVQIVVANVLIYWFLTNGYGLLSLALINVAAGVLEYAIVVVAALRTSFRGLSVGRNRVDSGDGREILRYSAVAFVEQMGNTLRSKIDPVIIGAVLGYSSVTLYAVGTRFPVYLTDIVGAVLGGQLLALFSQTQGRSGTAGESTGQFLVATRMSTVIAVFCGSSMIFYGTDFIERWMGAGFETSSRILIILTVPYVFSLMQYPCLSYIYSIAKHRYLAMVVFAAGAANVVLSLILVRFFGIDGVVWATFIEMIVVYLAVFPVMICRLTGIRLGHYYSNALLSPLGACLMILVPFFVAARPFLEADYGRLMLMGSLQVAIFIPLCYLFVLRDSERSLIKSALRIAS